jgi:hypothetical protein
MLWRDAVQLIPTTYEPGAYGAMVPVDGTPREVMCNVRDAGRTETYQALAAGVRVELIIDMIAAEYNREPKLTWNGETLYVARQYSKGGDYVALSMSRYPVQAGG